MTPISIAITHYNRYDMVVRSFEQVLDDERISEFIIQDDASTDDSYSKLQDFFKGNPKVNLFRNERNWNMSKNKFLAIQNCSSKFVGVWDSDNLFGKEYLDALEGVGFDEKTILQPCFAKNNFNFAKHQGIKIDKHNIASFMEDMLFRCSLNACNYVVSRQEYLDTYEYDPGVLAWDTISFLYKWLLKGNTYFIVPGLEYVHTTGPHSGYMKDVEINMFNSIKYENLIRELK